MTTVKDQVKDTFNTFTDKDKGAMDTGATTIDRVKQSVGDVATAVADYAVIAIINGWLFQAMEARVQNLQRAYDDQVSANVRKDGDLERAAQQLRTPLQQVRGSLEPLVHGQIGAITTRQAEAVHAALDRLTAIERQIDGLLPAPAAAG